MTALPLGGHRAENQSAQAGLRVGYALGSPDVLLSGGQGEDEAATAQAVRGLPHQPAIWERAASEYTPKYRPDLNIPTTRLS